MSSGESDPESGLPGRTNETDERMRALRDRLDKRPKTTDLAESSDSSGTSARSGIAQAWRLSSEFIAGVLVGVGLGWGFDLLFGTSPWGLIGFLFLGFGAAVLNVLRASGQLAPSRLNITTADSEDVDKSS